MKSLLWLLACLSISTPSDATVGLKPGVGPVDNLAQAHLVRVKAGGRRYLYNGYADGCPKLIARCKRKGFFLPGDVLVATDVVGPFTSVEYVDRNGVATGGYVASGSLAPVERPVQPMSSWSGTWRRDDETGFEIKPTKFRGQWRAEGTALWGTHDPERVKRGSVHTGSIEGRFRPTDNWAGLIDTDSGTPVLRNNDRIDWEHDFPYNKSDGYDCQVRLRLLEPYLLAYDDGDKCGGVNVSFTGAYRRF